MNFSKNDIDKGIKTVKKITPKSRKKILIAISIFIVVLITGTSIAQASGKINVLESLDKIFGKVGETPTTTQPANDKITDSAPATNTTYFADLKSLRDAKSGQSASSTTDENDGSKYDRKNYKHWESIKNSGYNWNINIPSDTKCDSREAALIRDAKKKGELDTECAPKGSGWEWIDPYGIVGSNNQVTYKTFTTKSGLDIDHIVALKAVERSGGYKMDANTRMKIANDPINLITTDAKPNRSKSDQTAATYIPPGTFRCEYISRQVQVKKKYNLSVSGAERLRLEQVGKECKFS